MRVISWNLLRIVLCVVLATPQVRATFSLWESEKNDLIVIFNQPKYAPGDTAYFTAYLLSDEYRLVKKKQVVSIKLLGQKNEVILHERVLFSGGVAVNQFAVPQALESGVYQLIFLVETGLLTRPPVLYIGHLVVSGKNLLLWDSNKNVHLTVDNSKLNITTDRDAYNRRSKVNVLVTPAASLKKNEPTLLAITVYNEQLFKKDNDDQSVCTALLMSPQKQTTNTVQKDSSSSKIVDFPYYFMGKAFIKSTGEAVPDHSKVTFYLNKSDFAYEIYTRQGGHFIFPLFSNFESEKVFYKISYEGNVLNDGQIVLYDFPLHKEVMKYEQIDTLDAYGLYSQQRHIINKSYGYFLTKNKKNEAGIVSDDVIESDHEVLLEKFEPFASMADVLINVVPMVGYKKAGDTERIRVFLKRTAKYGNHDPLYIVNGVMIDDTKYILSLNPLRVQKIGVLRSENTLRRFGDLGLEGILVVETDRGDGNIEEGKNTLFIEGINKTKTYRKFTYNEDGLKSKIPDLRSSLYWNPTVNLSGQTSFDFYTSDDTGYYVIQIVGLQDGKLFVSKSGFHVTNSEKN